jgi:hypothetical protein
MRAAEKETAKHRPTKRSKSGAGPRKPNLLAAFAKATVGQPAGSKSVGAFPQEPETQPLFPEEPTPQHGVDTVPAEERDAAVDGQEPGEADEGEEADDGEEADEGEEAMQLLAEQESDPAAMEDPDTGTATAL